jgi:DNA-binding transcriptional ArsR family regulator
MPDKESVRDLTDSRMLAAMSHLVRRRLLDALAVDGPSTVSMLAARTGEAVGNVSHHMKVLAEARLVEEAHDLARDRRERWWRASSPGWRWSTSTFKSDPVAAVVADAANSLNFEHQISKVRAWNARSDTADPAWVDAAFSTDYWLVLSPAELAELSATVKDLLGKWHDREIPDDGQQREPVFVFARGMPATP